MTEQEAKDALWDHAKKFISEQNIHRAETIYQTDRVIENAYEFIEGVADIVGYHDDGDEGDDD